MSTEVAVLWLLVFIIGVVVGIIAIIALGTMRKDQPDPEHDLWPERDHGASGIPGHWDGGLLTDERPHWPEASDSDGTS
jgi:hypothetical protein